MKKEFTQTLKILLAAVVLSLGVSYAYAWTAPTDAPPAGNTPAPVNEGFNIQSKLGKLILNTNIASQYPTGLEVFGDANFYASGSSAGNVTATAFLYSSDERLKENITPLDNASKKIQELQGVSFEWKKDGKESIGFIAQDVEKIFPELVVTNSATGMKSVQYAGIIAPLVETVKGQQKQIDILKTEIEELKNR